MLLKYENDQSSRSIKMDCTLITCSCASFPIMHHRINERASFASSFHNIHYRYPVAAVASAVINDFGH